MQETYGIFTESIQRTESVTSYRFRLEEDVDFKPGQFLQVMFDETHKSNKDMNKYLSLSCSPNKDFIEVTKRLSGSQFSASLRALEKGDRILFKAPLGNCIYKDEYSSIGFLIGGIGITPVISILEYISEKGLATEACLLYSNRYSSDIAFRDVLDTLDMENPHITVVHTITDCAAPDEECRTGRIDKKMVHEVMPDYQHRIIFMYGSPGMVASMKDMCLDMSCDPDRLKAENFLGY